MADSGVDELRMLRARAYGPNADIHDDEAALARLHELEDEARLMARPRMTDARPAAGGTARPTSPTAAPEDPLAAFAPLLGEGHDSTSPDARSSTPAHAPSEIAAVGPRHPDTDPDPDPETGRTVDGAEPTPSATDRNRESEPADHAGSASPARRRGVRSLTAKRLGLLWAVSLIATALVASGVTLAITSTGAPQVALLSVNEDDDWPDDLFGEKPPGAQRFDDFAGLIVVSVPGWGSTESAPCLYVLAPSSSQGTVSTGGCAAGEFPAAGALTVTGSTPSELRDRFRVGTSLQFVLDGSRVRVYSDGAPRE
ncbi:hypothetical protein [Microbacterium sp. Marseille-Q6648]|uniref:hypothetical protein n=1 Tax=Microbacterium sp. Marseille-Q6648 TaxID=2937991 RepID=UPI002042458F|nr:hypothetical protein [Microbacterium sp. Marseille-Q6648]